LNNACNQDRITPASISSLNRDRQVAYARLAHKPITLRLTGRSDAAVVEELSDFVHASRTSSEDRIKPGHVFHRQLFGEQLTCGLATRKDTNKVKDLLTATGATSLAFMSIE
jgi:hypothetical protein